MCEFSINMETPVQAALEDRTPSKLWIVQLKLAQKWTSYIFLNKDRL